MTVVRLGFLCLILIALGLAVSGYLLFPTLHSQVPGPVEPTFARPCYEDMKRPREIVNLP